MMKVGKRPEMLKMDSLVESAFNSEKNLEWRNFKPEPRDRLLPSEASEDEFNLFDESSSDEEEHDIMLDDADINIQRIQDDLRLKA